MDDDDRNQALLDHGWRHFEFHAQQRLSLFNFYIVFCGLVVAAWASIMTSSNPQNNVGVLLSLLLPFFSYMFWRMDQRNGHLTKRSEDLMAEAERGLFGKAECLFFGEGADELLSTPSKIVGRQWSHGTSLRVIFVSVACLGVAGAFYSALAEARVNEAVLCRTETLPKDVKRSPRNCTDAIPDTKVTPPPSEAPQ